jgi:hypothetical protein
VAVSLSASSLPSVQALLSGDTLKPTLLAELCPSTTATDNFEGLAAVVQGTQLRVFIVADNNFNPRQRRCRLPAATYRGRIGAACREHLRSLATSAHTRVHITVAHPALTRLPLARSLLYEFSAPWPLPSGSTFMSEAHCFDAGRSSHNLLRQKHTNSNSGAVALTTRLTLMAAFASISGMLLRRGVGAQRERPGVCLV